MAKHLINFAKVYQKHSWVVTFRAHHRTTKLLYLSTTNDETSTYTHGYYTMLTNHINLTYEQDTTVPSRW